MFIKKNINLPYKTFKIVPVEMISTKLYHNI